MVNLVKQAENKKNIILIPSIIISLLFVAEIFLLFKKVPILNISLLIGVLGFLGVLTLHWSYLKSCRYLIKAVIKNLIEKKPQNINGLILRDLLVNNFSEYLRKSHVFLPRRFKSKNELLRIEKLSSCISKYKAYADLNLLEEFSKEILIKNQEFRVLLKELFVDISLFLIPMLVVQFSSFQNTEVLILVLCVMRLFTFGFYFKLFKKSRNEKSNFKKIEHFLFGSFEDEKSTASRIELDILNMADSKSVFFLIDSSRRGEIEDLIREQTLGSGSFKEWSIISAENSIYKNKVKLSKAFILFPSEMLFPFAEMQEFISAFNKVIVIDSSPSYAISHSEFFYLDQNQEIKKIHFSENFDRLSGDKGLILRNFKRNNLDLFLTQIEMKIISKDTFFLIYADIQGKTSHDKNFIYPSGFKMVSMSDTLKGVDPDFSCDLSKGSHLEKMQRAKNFVANYSYHNVCSRVVIERKLKKSFRVS